MTKYAHSFPLLSVPVRTYLFRYGSQKKTDGRKKEEKMWKENHGVYRVRSLAAVSPKYALIYLFSFAFMRPALYAIPISSSAIWTQGIRIEYMRVQLSEKDRPPHSMTLSSLIHKRISTKEEKGLFPGSSTSIFSFLPTDIREFKAEGPSKRPTM